MDSSVTGDTDIRLRLVLQQELVAEIRRTARYYEHLGDRSSTRANRRCTEVFPQTRVFLNDIEREFCLS
ncbi:MAG TPA: hypothetical protein VGO22_09870 [Pseudorhizobium sp.]|nr:hypothetical protein [Pseudorhizobium sp.]